MDGNWNKGSNAGVVTFNGNSSLSNYNFSIEVRLAYLPQAIGKGTVLGKDNIPWQKSTRNDSRSVGRQGGDSASGGRIGIDRSSGGSLS